MRCWIHEYIWWKLVEAEESGDKNVGVWVCGWVCGCVDGVPENRGAENS